MSKIVYAGNSIFVDAEPLSEDEIREVLIHDWSPKLKDVKVHAVVNFSSLERAYYGLSILEKGPKSKPVVSVDVGMQTFENVAPLNDLSEAIEELSVGHRSGFEEFPFVEISTLIDYDRVLVHSEDVRAEAPHAWSPKKKKGDYQAWGGPGVYDLRDKPPTKHAKSVEAYEIEGMKFWATDTIDFMFQGEEWKEKLKDLFAEYRELA